MRPAINFANQGKPQKELQVDSGFPSLRGFRNPLDPRTLEDFFTQRIGAMSPESQMALGRLARFGLGADPSLGVMPVSTFNIGTPQKMLPAGPTRKLLTRAPKEVQLVSAVDMDGAVLLKFLGDKVSVDEVAEIFKGLGHQEIIKLKGGFQEMAGIPVQTFRVDFFDDASGLSRNLSNKAIERLGGMQLLDVRGAAKNLGKEKFEKLRSDFRKEIKDRK